MNIPWDAIIEMIIELISNCPENRRLKAAKNPMIQRWAVGKALRAEGFSRGDLRAARKEVMAEISAATDTEIEDFVDCCG